MKRLADKVALIVGVANSHSIAAGCAQAFHAAGADIAMTYLNEAAKPFVSPVAEAVNASLLLPLDVEAEGEMQAVFDAVSAKWGKIDILVHSRQGPSWTRHGLFPCGFCPCDGYIRSFLDPHGPAGRTTDDGTGRNDPDHDLLRR